MPLRWLPFVAWHFCVTAVVLSFITLLAGVGSDSSAAIITFNTSSLGINDYSDLNSTLHAPITALVPPNIHPASITQYLGIKDWYSVHFVSICSGFYSPTLTGDFLTIQTTNTTCIRKSGYVFNLQNTLREGLHPTVKGIADEVASVSYHTTPWIVLWCIGLVFAVVEMVLLLLAWFGKRRVNGYCLLLVFISYITLQIACALTTGHSLTAHHNGASASNNPTANYFPPTPYATAFFALAWTSSACMVIAFALEHLEWRFELWTLKGERITMYKKPPLKSWRLLDSVYWRKPVEVEASSRDDEWEMRQV